MTFRRITLFAFVAAVSGMVSLLHSKTVTTSPIPEIRLLRTPNKGIQPQSAVDSQGVLHMIYFKGDASAGDIEYVRRAPGEREFSSPIRFNSRLHSALAVGTVRGPQMALGREGRIYGVWFGSQKESGGELARSGPSCLDGRDFMERGRRTPLATLRRGRQDPPPAGLRQWRSGLGATQRHWRPPREFYDCLLIQGRSCFALNSGVRQARCAGLPLQML
jgi:hypothetical protein